MSNQSQFDALVVGAGIVGVAAARALALRGLSVAVLERHQRAGEETSARNSGVIHSGIYYPRNSLKARLCLEGRELLYQYCDARHVSHRRVGKLIVAQAAQIDALRALMARGLENGVHDLEWLTAAQAHEMEPLVRCEAAILSPSTGILDVHELLTAMVGDLESASGMVITRTEVTGAAATADGFQVRMRDDEEGVTARLLINAAGLNAVGMLGHIEGYPRQLLREAFYAKGNYFSCTARPFSRLVYPMPGEAGLGVHATLDLDGRTRFGPDVEWVGSLGYDVDAARGDAFYESIREYWPGLPDGALQPDYAGIRPKLVGPRAAAADFVIEGPADHGVPGLVNLLGIESPGLTSSLAIASYVASMLLDAS